jgi:tetratricopeptide (TPR) repeat protein
MNPRVLKRFIVLMAILIVVSVLFSDMFRQYFRQEPGDYHTKRGDQLLTAGDYEAAMESFDLALKEMPDHRGALMGRAAIFIQTERYDDALAELDHLIGYLEKNLDPDDKTGVGALAAAHANRGIVLDRTGRYEEALDSYVESLKIDQEVVEGPGVVHKILYGGDRVSSVRDRAVYIYEQLKLPEEERVLSVPEIDEQQRMHKP